MLVFEGVGRRKVLVVQGVDLNRVEPEVVKIFVNYRWNSSRSLMMAFNTKSIETDA